MLVLLQLVRYTLSSKMLYMSVCLLVCMYVCIYVYMYVCMYACMYVCMHACMYICMYVCMYIGMYVCIYVCIHNEKGTTYLKNIFDLSFFDFILFALLEGITYVILKKRFLNHQTIF